MSAKVIHPSVHVKIPTLVKANVVEFDSIPDLKFFVRELDELYQDHDSSEEVKNKKYYELSEFSTGCKVYPSSDQNNGRIYSMPILLEDAENYLKGKKDKIDLVNITKKYPIINT